MHLIDLFVFSPLFFFCPQRKSKELRKQKAIDDVKAESYVAVPEKLQNKKSRRSSLSLVVKEDED